MSKIDQGINTANKIGDLFNSWVRIAIIFGTAILSCGMAYYKIYDNEKEIIIERNERMKQEQVIEERSDKRYARAMETARELKDYIKDQESRILELEKKVAFMEGVDKGKNTCGK